MNGYVAGAVSGVVGGVAGAYAGALIGSIAAPLGTVGAGIVTGVGSGAIAGGVGSGAGYLAAWGMNAAMGNGSGYSWGQFGEAVACGAAFGGAMGFATWGIGYGWNALRGAGEPVVPTGNAELAAGGGEKAAATSADDALGVANGEASRVAKQVSPNATVQQGAAQAQEAQAQAATKAAPRSRVAAAPGPKATAAPVLGRVEGEEQFFLNAEQRMAAGGAPKALPAPRQVDASWGVSNYRHGGQMTGMEHIMYRHSSGSGFSNVSRFAEGTMARDVVGYVDDALRYGRVTQTSPAAYTIEYDFSRAIGTNAAGNEASSIRVFVRDGIIQSAFPF